MQNRLLNSRIESSLTLVVSLLSVDVIVAGTLGMGRSFDPATDANVAVVHLEPVVITSQRSAVRVARLSAAEPVAQPVQ